MTVTNKTPVTTPPVDPTKGDTTTPPADPVITAPKGETPLSQPKPTDPPTPDETENLTAEQWKAETLKLRKENATRRHTNKDLQSQHDELKGKFSNLETGLKKLFGGEDDDLTPEQRVQSLQAKNEDLETRAAMADLVVEHGIGKDASEYFQFLIMKEVEKLEENEELSEERITEIATMAKSKSGASSTSVGSGNNGDGDPPPPPINGEAGPTLIEFKAMTITEKSKLYQQNKVTYEALLKQERTSA